eukprot:g2255.t1
MPGYEDRASILQGAGDTIFQLVLDRATPEQWAEWLRAPLEHAAGTANYDLVQKLLKAGADGSAGWKGCHGKTLLHAATEGGDGKVMSALMRAGAEADMEAPASRGRTPLHLAAFRGKQAAAGALTMAGANVNSLDANNDTPLHLAIERGHVGIAKDLLLSGADPGKTGSKGEYPVYLAASRGQDEVVLSLVHKKTNLNYLGSRGNTPLTPLAVAVREDRLSVAELLLDGGADANFRMHCSKTALHTAVEHNKPGAIPALVESGADIEARSDAGMTPLATAPIFGSHAAMLVLLQLGASVNTKNNRGWTPLHAACRRGNADSAEVLLRWGADETFVTDSGKTPSQYVPDVAHASGEDRPRLERLAMILASAPQDRAWRRRGFLVMCRARQVRLVLVEEIPDREAAGTGQPPERPRRRIRPGHVKVELGVNGAQQGDGAGARGTTRSGNVRAKGRGTGGERAGRGFGGVAAWLMAVTDENLFRKVVAFL